MTSPAPQTQKTSDSPLVRAEVLLQLRRYAEAEKLLGEFLAREPQSARAHVLMAEAISHQKGRLGEAIREAKSAIGIDPNRDDAYYTLGGLLFYADPPGAQAALETALRLKPQEPLFYALLARLHLDQGRVAEALKTAEAGRSAAPMNIHCANVQAVALMKLGRKSQAAQVINEALRLDPENAAAHTAHGWSLLDFGEGGLARVAFGEALRLDPASDNARDGMVEALKTRWPVYGGFLRFLLAWSRWPGLARLAMIFVFFIVITFAGVLLAGALPGQAWIGAALILLSLVTGFLALIARQIFDLFLRLDPYARMALSDDQMIRSNWVIASGVAGLLAVLAWWISGSVQVCGLVGLVSLFLARPLAGVVDAQKKKRDEMKPF